jgi:hypothetical protein
MQLTRRTFAQALLGFAAIASIPLGGCISIPALINIVVAAIGSLQTILGTLMPPAALVVLNLVKAGLADLGAAVAQWRAAPASSKGTFLAKINLLLSDIVANFQSFLSQVLPGAGTIVALVESVAQLILSTIAGIAGDLPQPAMSISVRLSRGTVPVIPTKRDAKQFKSQFNALVTQAGYPQAVLN